MNIVPFKKKFQNKLIGNYVLYLTIFKCGPENDEPKECLQKVALLFEKLKFYNNDPINMESLKSSFNEDFWNHK
jgi:hypothetical protein